MEADVHKFLTPSPTHRRDPESRWVCRAMPVGRGGGWVQHPLAGTTVKREAGGEKSQHEPLGLKGALVDKSLASWQALLEHKTSRELRNLCPPTHRAALCVGSTNQDLELKCNAAGRLAQVQPFPGAASWAGEEQRWVPAHA